MRALQIHEFGPLDRLETTDVPDPGAGAGEVRVAIEAAGINPSDLGVALGRFPHVTLPRVLGRDFAGRIVDGPRELIGTEVWGSGGGELGMTRDGTHAQFVTLPVNGFAARPPQLSAESAAAMGVPFVTAWSTLADVAQLSAGECAVISGGAGAVGSAAVQIALALGARAIALVRNDDEAAQAKAFNPTAIARSGIDDLPAIVRDANGGALANVALNVVGAPVFAPLLSAMGRGGRMVVISAAAGREATLDLFALYRSEHRILGFDSAKLGLHEAAPILTHISELVAVGKIAPAKVAERFPLERAREGYQRVESGSSGKVVLVP